MKMDKLQQFLHSEYASNIQSATGMLGSLKADYHSASNDFSKATSVSVSANNDPFDPNESLATSSANADLRNDRQRMAHDSAIAPQYQHQYQQWSLKDQDLQNNVNNTTNRNIGAELADGSTNQSDSNSADSDSDNGVHFVN